ncbi:arylamine N-acetyltransferase [Bacillus timonensis]|nr:arylamine N-acetyltransferase [Bacillus timonensis]
MKQWARDYLSVLNVEMKQPSFKYLTEICTQHLQTFAFENISKLVYYRDQIKNGFLIPTPSKFIENYQRYHFGGTCFTVNSNLLLLLRELGFDCYFVMLSKEHIGIIVKISEWKNELVYVDCGSAAPLFKPVRLQTETENQACFGQECIHLHSIDEKDVYEYQRYTNGQLASNQWKFNVTQQYTYEDFQSIIEKANKPKTHFMNILRCQLWQLDQRRNLSLLNNKLMIKYQDGRVEEHIIGSVEEMKRVLSEEFNLTKLPIDEALDVLKELGVDVFHKEHI